MWFAPAGDAELLWVSRPEARHSRNIAVRPEVAIVVFDSTVPIGAAAEEAIAVFSERSQACGARAWSAADVLPPATFRLYRATAGARFVLGPGDQRLPVMRDAP